MYEKYGTVSLTKYLGVKTSAVFLWRLVIGEVWTFWGNIGKMEFRYMQVDASLVGAPNFKSLELSGQLISS